MEKTRRAPEGTLLPASEGTGLPTKVCPMCGQLLFADMDICYGCLHDFRRKEPPAYGLPPMALSGWRSPGHDGAFADLDELPELTDRGEADREGAGPAGPPSDPEGSSARGQVEEDPGAAVGTAAESPHDPGALAGRGRATGSSGTGEDLAIGSPHGSGALAARGRVEEDPGAMTDLAIESRMPGTHAPGGPMRGSDACASRQPGASELRAPDLRAPDGGRAPNVSLTGTSRGGGPDRIPDVSGDLGLSPAATVPTRCPEASPDARGPQSMPELLRAVEGVRDRRGGSVDVSPAEPGDGGPSSEVMTELIEDPRRGPFLLRLQTQDLAVDVEVGPEGLLVGRAGDCDLVIHRRSVSRRHVRISRTGTGLSAMDQGATNPARIDDVPLQGCAPLPPGSTLDVCGVRLVHPA